MLNDLLRFDVKDCSWCRWVQVFLLELVALFGALMTNVTFLEGRQKLPGEIRPPAPHHHAIPSILGFLSQSMTEIDYSESF